MTEVGSSERDAPLASAIGIEVWRGAFTIIAIGRSLLHHLRSEFSFQRNKLAPTLLGNHPRRHLRQLVAGINDHRDGFLGHFSIQCECFVELRFA